ncbi:hypothetical protein M0805_004312 [Coniferiporia weirii]|nr:hypothetical protein M0805_004312 [Coniferiporia weirii]
MTTEALAELLREPFGPYRIADLLKDRKSLSSFRRPFTRLESVLFRQAGEIIGLDNIDDAKERDKAPVFFKGNIELADERWLTEDGKTWLRQDLLDRLGKAGKDFSRILQHPGYHVKVVVVGVLFGEPLDLETTGILKITSYDELSKKMNEFSVKTMHVHSYALSRVYFSKFRALRAIRQITDINQAVPIRERTPGWLIKEYIKLNKKHYGEKKEAANRTPRRVHRAEAYTVFGVHSQWLLTKIKKANLLNRSAWELFCKEIKTRRNQGITVSVEGDYDRLDKLWAEYEVPIPIDEGTPGTDEPGNSDIELEYMSDHGYKETYTHVAEKQRSPSLPPEPIPSISRAERRMTDVAVLAAIPQAFYRERPMFPADYIWCCPDTTCDYRIDFHNLVEENFIGMDEDDEIYLHSMRWNPSCDVRVTVLFHDMVESHYYGHLESIGVRLVASRPVEVDVFGRPVIEDQIYSGPRRMKPEDTDVCLSSSR